MNTVPPDDAALEAEDASAAGDGAEDASAGGDPVLAAERDRLARTLRDTRLQLAMTQARLSALEDSATLTLGRTLVRAARRPPLLPQVHLRRVLTRRPRSTPTPAWPRTGTGWPGSCARPGCSWP